MLEWVVSKVRPVERLWEDAKRDQLSNSGDILKLLVPNYNGNIICGWGNTKLLRIPAPLGIFHNHPYKVISQMMIERKIDNRGSKSTIVITLIRNISVFIISVVKEQRADGSWQEKTRGNLNTAPSRCFSCLRYALMGLEINCFPSRREAISLGFLLSKSHRNNLIKIPSKQLIKNFCITSNTNASSSITRKSSYTTFLNSTSPAIPKLNPWFVTGFTDAEGTFTVMIDKNLKRTLRWRVQAKYQICLHICDLVILEQIQVFFGGIGSVYKSGTLAYFSVSSVKDLTSIIIPHFERYFLLTQKVSDFILWKRIVTLINNKAHLSIEGLHQIINIKAAMNLGIDEEIKKEFNNIVSVNRPLTIEAENIPDPQWIAGFVNGEGTFDVKIYKSKTKIGYAVQLRFRIPQHERDTKLIELLIKYFEWGSIEKHSKFPAVTLVITKYTIISDKIIPFFELYPLIGQKQLDYLDWCKISKLMSERLHLSTEGFKLIRDIKEGMNDGRKKVSSNSS